MHIETETGHLPMTSRGMSQNRALAWLVLALFIASFAYLINLNAVSFWEDESWLAIAISGDLAGVWTFATERGVHPPLYFYIAYLTQFLFGTTEFALRWPGGLISLVGLAWTYRLGAETFGRRAGVYAVLLAAGSLFLMYYTRLARQYALFYTLSAALGWAYVRWQHHPDKRRWWWSIVGLQAALLYTHYFGGLMAIALGLHALLTCHWKRVLSLAGALALAGVFFLPWVPSIVIQLGGEHGSGLEYGVPDVPRIIENYAGRVSNASYLLGGALALLGTLALIVRRRWRWGALLFTWLVGTFIPVIIVNQTLFQWYIGRNMLYTLPAVMLLYGAGLAWLSRSRAGRAVSLLVIAVFGLTAGYVYEAYWPGTAGWRGAMQRVAVDARASDTYVIDGEPYSTQYYLNRYLKGEIAYHDMLEWTEEPTVNHRIWLIDSGQAVNPEAIAELPPGMVQTRRIVRLPVVAEFYQQTPSEPLVTFGELLQLGYTGFRDRTLAPGETLTLDAWWKALSQPEFNYSVGVFVMREGAVLVDEQGNFDKGRMDAGVLPVGEWVPDERSLTLPDDAPPGMYTVFVTVYDWRDGTRLSASPPADENLFPLLSVDVRP